MSLPAAEHQNPTCGVCFGETRHDGDEFECERCGLAFDSRTFEAEYIDPEAEPCERPCENVYHAPHRITQGWGFKCGPCQLPEGHPNLFHYTECHSYPILTKEAP